MSEDGRCPVGANTKDAPWNQKDLPEKKIDVTVSLTLSKTVKVKVSDYIINDSGKDEDGNEFEDIDYSDCNLMGAVKEQIVLPQNLAMFTEKMFNHDLDLRAAGIPKYLKDAIKDCKDWNVDDMEVILEN